MLYANHRFSKYGNKKNKQTFSGFITSITEPWLHTTRWLVVFQSFWSFLTWNLKSKMIQEFDEFLHIFLGWVFVSTSSQPTNPSPASQVVRTWRQLWVNCNSSNVAWPPQSNGCKERYSGVAWRKPGKELRSLGAWEVVVTFLGWWKRDPFKGC